MDIILKSDYLYRFERGHDKLLMDTYEIIRRTKKGAWIRKVAGAWGILIHSPDQRWIHMGSTRRFAWSSEEDALDSFIARKKSQIRILNSQLKQAHSDLNTAKEYKSRGIKGKEEEYVSNISMDFSDCKGVQVIL